MKNPSDSEFAEAVADVLNRLTTPRLATATFALADLGKQTASETWFDAHVGAAMYAAAHG